MQKEMLKKGLAILALTFPEKKFDGKVWWELLNDIDDKKFLIAVKDVCSTTKELYPGTNLIAIIREIALSGMYLLSGEAWEEVLKEVSRVGYVGIPKFKDAITEKAVNCIGWKTICASEMIGVERSHFTKIYEQLLDRDKSEEVKLEDCKQINRSGIDNVKRLTEGIG